MKRLTTAAALGAVLLLVYTGNASADCASPTIRFNAETGFEEKVWQEHDGQDIEIKWAQRSGNTWINQQFITNNAIDDTCPSLWIDPSGASLVCYRSGGGTSLVQYIARKNSSGTWTWLSVPIEVSDGVSIATDPFVLSHNGVPYVAWKESSSGGDAKVLVAGGVDGLEPWPSRFSSHLLMTFSDPGAVLVELRSENNKLWSTWIVSATTLKYSVLQESTGTWSSPSGVSVIANDFSAARAQARVEVLGL